MSITIKQIESDNNDSLEQVITLGDSNSSTLGHFPRGAYYEIAKKRWIIIAQRDNKVIGYLMFRIVSTKYSLSITHLCVDKDERSGGLAKQLFDKLLELYGNSFGKITLNCRDDYESAVKFWKRNGFNPKTSRRSRSKDEKHLTTWEYDLNNWDLFSSIRSQREQTALLDLNILIDLKNGTSDYEVETLMSDWLSNDVEFYFASEAYHEIYRDSNMSRRNEMQSFLRRFVEAKIQNRDDFEKIFLALKEVLPGETENDISDKKQLATAINNELSHFITRDSNLLKCSEQVLDKFGVKISDPIQFICEVDELTNKFDYNPSRLAGASFLIEKLRGREKEEVVEEFLKKGKSENKKGFRKSIDRILSSNTCEVLVVKDAVGKFQAILAKEQNGNSLEVPVFRIKKSLLANTLFKQLISSAMRDALKNGLELVSISEKHFTDREEEILQEHNFFKVNSLWVKLIPHTFIANHQINEVLSKYEGFDFVDNIIKYLDEFSVSSEQAFQMERMFFPLKIFNEQISTFIIPIKPTWSHQLFDSIEASNRIFSTNPEIAWNRENVYYRSATHVKTITSPARILWYVSDDGISQRRRMIIGCSYLDFCEVGKAKELYKKYKRYGVYEWTDVSSLAEKSTYKTLMVINFSDTELFETPISLEETRNILKENTGKQYSFQSPVKINEIIFKEIYSKGFNLIK